MLLLLTLALCILNLLIVKTQIVVISMIYTDLEMVVQIPVSKLKIGDNILYLGEVLSLMRVSADVLRLEFEPSMGGCGRSLRVLFDSNIFLVVL